MIILSLQNVEKSFGTNQVIKNATLTLQSGQSMGLVGVNGSGKTTLMRIIAGEEELDQGSVIKSRDLSLGYLAQHGTFTEEATVWDTLEAVFAPIKRIEEKMRILEADMAAAPDEAMLMRLGDAYGRLTHQYEQAEGYAWKSAITGVLTGLGFNKTQYDQPTSKLSGGEQTRLRLCRLLLQKPDLLLLDEPTNHLDLDAINWLEGYLRQYPGTVMVISHDRYFLDHVCDTMAELLLGVVEQYSGNYTRYMAQREERFEARMKAYDLQQKEIARQEAIIARYKQFNREKSIRAARSRERKLERLERLEKPKDEHQVHFSFTAGRRTGNDVLMVEELSKRFGDRTLFTNLYLHIRAGDRIALIGPNGVGKTTFFRCLTSELSPDNGTLRFGSNVDIGYYDQQQKTLHPEKTVLDEVWDEFPKMEQYEVRGALGLFLFTGDDVFMPIHTLSGGEKGRVALTKLMLRQDNFLLLDEPTNHLDMDSREVLEQTLEDFDGTILAISHDRYFINRFATHVAVLTESGLRLYLGNYDDYLQELNKERTPVNEDEGKTRTELNKEKKRSRESRELIKQAREGVSSLERAITACETQIAELEATMAQPETYQNESLAQETAKAYQQALEERQRLYEVWEAAALALEDLLE